MSEMTATETLHKHMLSASTSKFLFLIPKKWGKKNLLTSHLIGVGLVTPVTCTLHHFSAPSAGVSAQAQGEDGVPVLGHPHLCQTQSP